MRNAQAASEVRAIHTPRWTMYFQHEFSNIVCSITSTDFKINLSFPDAVECL